MSQAKSTRWCFTLNNYTAEDIVAIATWDTKYLVYGKEIASTGTPHLQGFCILKTQQRLSAVKKLHAKAHWEVAKGTSLQASNYCKKDSDYMEFGILSMQGKRTDLESAIDDIKSGVGMSTVADNHPVVFVKYGRGLRDLALLLAKPYQHQSVRGIWIYGPPGTGKSHCARELSPSMYIKPQNKWFDGYNGEAVILLEDLDTNVLGHYLKIWSDKYPCTGETKGGTTHLQHKLFVVTSNYSIEELWPEDNMVVEALNRRFTVIYKTNKNQLIDYLKLT